MLKLEKISIMALAYPILTLSIEFSKIYEVVGFDINWKGENKIKYSKWQVCYLM